MKTQDENFDTKTYVGVHERLAAFRKQYPEGYETTFRAEVEGGISFKCLLFRNKDDVNLYGATSVAAASGHSFLPGELDGEKVEEYAETVALGRALAKLGFSVENSLASSEEMDQYSRKKAKASKEDDSGEEEEEEERPKKRRRRASRRDEEDETTDDNEESESEEEEEERPKKKRVRRVSRFAR